MKSKMKYILIAAAALVLIILLSRTDTREKITEIKRPGYDDGKASYSVMCEKNGKSSMIDISINPMKMGDEELQKAFDEAFEEICGQLPGKNESMDYIMSDLNFVSRIDRFGMNVEYFSDNYEIIDGMGRVNNETLEENQECIIEIIIIYGDLQQSYKLPVTVVSKVRTDMEIFADEVSREINAKSENSRYVELPSEINGEKVTFYRKKEGILSYVFLAVLAVFTVIYNNKIYKPKKAAERKDKELMSDYPEIVSKLSLLMGAGMSAYNALKKIVADNPVKREKNGAYTELAYCVNRIASGVSESDAYREFGKKCRLMPYVRFSNLLVQNINRGSENIFELLKEETVNAFNERKNTAKKMGEEAGTKLLLPMGMSLAVVLVIIIFPSLYMYF